MTVEVKICGLKTETALTAALDAGADYVGFVFFPPSPRNVSNEVAARLAAIARGRASIVALLVDADDAAIEAMVAAVKPDILQLHGNESVARVREIRQRFALPVMKAIAVAAPADAQRALDYRDAADRILFDAKAPKGAVLPGGNGVSFDWRLLDGVKSEVRYMLSGGLTPATVAAAIAATGARAVDVSSGVERAPGEKDPALIRAFIAAARAAGTPKG